MEISEKNLAENYARIFTVSCFLVLLCCIFLFIFIIFYLFINFFFCGAVFSHKWEIIILTADKICGYCGNGRLEISERKNIFVVFGNRVLYVTQRVLYVTHCDTNRVLYLTHRVLCVTHCA